MRFRSPKMARVYRTQRVALVQKILDERPVCQLRLPGVCRGRSTTVHEIKTRARGGSILDEDNCLASCAPCNDNVADWRFKDYVKERGLLKHSWED